jgi:hypothetical protein
MARIMCQRYCSEGISKWSTSSDEEKESSKYRSYYPGTLADLYVSLTTHSISFFNFYVLHGFTHQMLLRSTRASQSSVRRWQIGRM